jgi:hypothetical protein
MSTKVFESNSFVLLFFRRFCKGTALEQTCKY